MASNSNNTFERIFQLAQSLPLPNTEDERQISWCEDRQVLGVSRQPGGAFELFIRGEELRPRLQLVKRHLKFDRWERAGGEVFQASRLVLPADQHFLPMAAFLAEELIRCGVGSSPMRAFSNTEPLIEMALRRVALGEEELLGLLAELRFLEVLLSAAGADLAKRTLAIQAWHGHEHGSRDFLVGNRAMEVKATRGRRSHHRISSVFQVDPRRNSSDEPQESLSLISFGFEPDTSSENWGLTLPGQVDRLLKRMTGSESDNVRSELQVLFLEKLRMYGASTSAGYDHDAMRTWAAYQTRWQHTFVRIYDMTDPAVQVLRRTDIQSRGHVILASVGFEVDLPDMVSGDLNPRTDLEVAAASLLGLP